MTAIIKMTPFTRLAFKLCPPATAITRRRPSIVKQRVVWPLIPITIGLGFYQLYGGEAAKDAPISFDSVKAAVMKMMPLRTISRLWGHINSAYDLPVWLRSPVYQAWTKAFGCDLGEMKAENLRDFRNLDEFFTRELKEGMRPLSPCALVSPADSTVIHFGPVVGGQVEQIKEMTYSLEAFLGLGKHALDPEDIEMKLPGDPEQNQLYHCIFYLAPGDYHRFHSPANWVIEKIKHYSGQLLSVSPAMVNVIPDLFVLNERIAMTGRWTHGFFAMVAVGATNVGSINLSFDKYFRTNHHMEVDNGAFTEKCLKTMKTRSNKPEFANQHRELMQVGEGGLDGYWMIKGNEVGKFHLGSTVVLVFEAPKGLEFNVEPGTKVKYGQKICEFPNQ
eukprot:Partr_v1_DN29013_c0_g1_i1_m58655 putative Phosphatidylserine decarboxylase